MSDNYLRLVPTAPTHVPTPASLERARSLASGLCPSADQVVASLPGGIQFFDCGANLESVSCALCGAEVMDWFLEEIGRKFELNGFQDLQSQAPCCLGTLNLNNLVFDWPAAFASAAIEIRNPGRDWLTESELQQVSAALGHRVTQILARY